MISDRRPTDAPREPPEGEPHVIPLTRRPSAALEASFDAWRTSRTTADGLSSAYPPPLLPDPEPGSMLDHFRVEGLLGRCALGSVFVAHDTSLDRRVALKMLHDPIAAAESEDRLLREARAQARLTHPNVGQIHYIGHAHPEAGRKGRLFLAMELVDGAALDVYVDNGERMPPEQARRCMLDVARGLRAAQNAGIIHRDIKPSNLIRSAEGVVKIVDFGLAKRLHDGAHTTNDLRFVGSPLYMSPEQANGDALDQRSDMYALGATFFHLLTGHPPFVAPTPLEVMVAHAVEPPPPLSSYPSEIPAPMRRIIHRLLAKKPEERFPTYDVLIAALERAAPERTQYAGYWVQAASAGIDALAAALAAVVLGKWVGVLYLAHVVVGQAYWGQSLGKYLVQVQVTRTDGRPLGLVRSFVRTALALWLPLLLWVLFLVSGGPDGLTRSGLGDLPPAELREVAVALVFGHAALALIYGAGLALAGFHPQKRAVHDLMTDAVVTYKLPGGH